MKNEDKSLLEVWEWKKQIYEEVKDLDEHEYVKKMKRDAERLLHEHGIILPVVSLAEKKM